jgi:hypothetical protein
MGTQKWLAAHANPKEDTRGEDTIYHYHMIILDRALSPLRRLLTANHMFESEITLRNADMRLSNKVKSGTGRAAFSHREFYDWKAQA